MFEFLNCDLCCFISTTPRSHPYTVLQTEQFFIQIFAVLLPLEVIWSWIKSDSRMTTTTNTTTTINDTVKLADLENHSLEPKITTLSYTQPKLWPFTELFNFPHRHHCNFSYFFEKNRLNVKFKFSNPQKTLPCVKPRHVSYRALQSVRSFFSVEDGKKKGRHKKSRRRYISPICEEALRK